MVISNYNRRVMESMMVNQNLQLCLRWGGVQTKKTFHGRGREDIFCYNITREINYHISGYFMLWKLQDSSFSGNNLTVAQVGHFK